MSSTSVPYIRDILKEHGSLFIVLTETWLRDQLDAEIAIENYNVYRVDRSRDKRRRGRNSGGVAVYLKNDIATACQVLMEYTSDVIEGLCLTVPLLNLVLCAVYRQPNDIVGGHTSKSAQFSVFLDKLSEELDGLPSPTPDVILAGDFNLPHAVWPQCEPSAGASGDEKQMIQMLSTFSSKHFMTQLVTQQTHKAGNTLDLLLSNNPNSICLTKSVPTEPVSSHHLVTFECAYSPVENSAKRTEFSRAFDHLNMFSDHTNWQEINRSLEDNDWIAQFSYLTPTQMMDKLLGTCEVLANQYSPRKRKSGNKSHQIPRHRKILMRKRRKLQIRLQKQSGSAKNITQSKLVDVERQLQNSYKCQENHDEAKAVGAIRKNPKFFYTYARKFSKVFSPVGPLRDSTNNLVRDPTAMASILSNQYIAAFSTPTQVNPAQIQNEGPTMNDIVFSETDIIRAIDEISTNAAPGPDGFPAIMLKNCKRVLAKPLYLIWRHSLDTGSIPGIDKTSHIIPIHKGGPRELPKNYRPVALTSHLIKVFEKVLRRELVGFVEVNDLLNHNQHGFRAGKSCLSQLLQHFDLITQMLEEGKNIDVVYLDFAKAFDKLDFQITLNKLKKLGIQGKVLEWIQAFLTYRKQYVCVDGHSSRHESVLSGVPQGSVIGPLLFLVLLGDIGGDVQTCHVSSFADDTRVLAGIREQGDISKMQDDLDSIYRWSQTNNMKFNSEKFECLRYGKDSQLKESAPYLSENGTPIEQKTKVRDLGVLMTSDAMFKEHITATVAAASQKCGWVLRSFKTRERDLMITLWKSLVAPILDYCSQLWCPSSLGEIQRLELVQKNFFRKISGMSGLDYWQQLEALNIFSLQRRRERYVCIYTWKVLEGLVPNFGIESSWNQRRGRCCTIPSVRRSASAQVQNIRFGSMGINGPRLFNCLPAHLRNMSYCSTESFKRALDNHLRTVTDEPRVPRLTRYCTKSSNSLLAY